MHRAALPLLAAVLVAAACASPKQPVLRDDTAARVDFSGSWELHYGLSDRIEEEIRLQHLLARRTLERNAQLPAASTVTVGGRGRVNSSSSIIGLAQLAETISRAKVLTIEQNERQVMIERDDEFPLSCRFDRAGRPIVDPLGTELCGWDGHQLVFVIQLPDGLRVRHRLTLSPDGQHLNVATTVQTRRAPQPFTFDRVYERFEPPPPPFDCHETLDRGRVCLRIGDRQG